MHAVQHRMLRRVGHILIPSSQQPLAKAQRACRRDMGYQRGTTEAAEAIEVSEGAVKLLIHRAREKLAKDLLHLKTDRQEN